MAQEKEARRLTGVPQLPVDPGELAEGLKPLGSERRLRVLQYLTRPRYLEEIASYLGVARQTAQRHVDQLLEVGAIRKQQGQRDSGPVVEYVVVPQRFFALAEDLFQLGSLEPEEDDEAVLRTERTDGPGAQARETQGPGLVVAHGLQPGTVHRLTPTKGPWRIGRDEAMDIRFDHDPFVSNKHAQVLERDGGHVLVDTYSTNGSYVNWSPLPPGQEHELEPGDIVGIGKTRLVYWP